MGVGVEGNADVGVAHDVLQSLGVHSALGHVGAEGVSADVGRDLRKLHFIDTVVLIQNVLEVLLPVQSHHRHLILVQKQEAGIAVDRRLYFRFDPIGKDPPKAVCDLFGHGNHPRAAGGFCRLYDIRHVPLSLQLMIHVDPHFLEVDIAYRQTAKLGDAQSGMEQTS